MMIANTNNEDLQYRKELQKAYIARQLKLTPTEQKFITEKLSSKLWRLNNLYTIRDKNAQKRIMKLNDSQKKVLLNYRHPRKITLKSRQQGISTLAVEYNLDSCLFTPGYAAGIQSYGLDESNKLQGKAELMWEEFDPDIKGLLGLELVKNNQKTMVFSNGSVLKIGNFRGDTLQSLHVSELAKIDHKYPEKSKELKTGAFQAVGKNNKITIESTAMGKSGLFYEIWKKTYNKAQKTNELSPFDFQPIFLSWVDDNDCKLNQRIVIPKTLEKYFDKLEKYFKKPLTKEQKWWYAAKYEELGEDIKQEYPSTPEEAFEQSIEGSYYRNEFSSLTIKPNLYDENLLVHFSMDLGMNDTFSIGFFQIHPNGKLKIIGEYANSGHGLQHYREIFDAISKKKGWKFSMRGYVPHDIKVRELIADKTRWQAMKELGFKPILVSKHRLADGIEATRQFLKEIEIDSSCEMIIGAIQNYRKKYDRSFNVFLDAPVHDEWSHPADMLRYMAMGYKNKPITQNLVYENYSYNTTKILTTSSYDI